MSYCRSVYAVELLPQNAIVRKPVPLLEHAPAYRIPSTVDGEVSAGKESEEGAIITKTDTPMPEDARLNYTVAAQEDALLSSWEQRNCRALGALRNSRK